MNRPSGEHARPGVSRSIGDRGKKHSMNTHEHHSEIG